MWATGGKTLQELYCLDVFVSCLITNTPHPQTPRGPVPSVVGTRLPVHLDVCIITTYPARTRQKSACELASFVTVLDLFNPTNIVIVIGLVLQYDSKKRSTMVTPFGSLPRYSRKSQCHNEECWRAWAVKRFFFCELILLLLILISIRLQQQLTYKKRKKEGTKISLVLPSITESKGLLMSSPGRVFPGLSSVDDIHINLIFIMTEVLITNSFALVYPLHTQHVTSTRTFSICNLRPL